MKWLRKILKRHAEAAQAEESAAMTKPVSQGSGAPSMRGYSSDEPISSSAQDRFNRSSFARRIAETISSRSDPSSLVIGLFGPWGDGKTSTLRMMEEALTGKPHIVLVRFNPWHFGSTELLLRGFFGTLSDALGKSLPTWKEKAGKFLEKYGAAASYFVDASKLGEKLSTVELDSLRNRVEDALKQSGKRVVVLIDDIDRLDREEIHTILKLVKLSADFKYMAYVLSFDDEMVAAAIAERYGSAGSRNAGRSFLEKIVQVPLHLPPADEIALRKATFEEVEGALNAAGTAISQEQVDAFVNRFIEGIEPRLQTPRQAKLYGNALTFALPLLKDEANPVDLMLLEGVRIFYPKLYAAIRDNELLFINPISIAAGAGARDAARQSLTELFATALSELGAREQEQLRRGLLERLFPRLSSVFANLDYGPDSEREWGREQRICSAHYFKRYFNYSVPPGDVRDGEVIELLDRIETLAADESDVAFQAFSTRGAWPRLIRKLRERADDLPEVRAVGLVRAFARNCATLPREAGFLINDDTMMQAAILVSQLLRRVPAGEARQDVARTVIDTAEPLRFAFECWRWMRHEDSDQGERLIPEAAEQELLGRMVNRIRNQAQAAPLYQTHGRDAPALLWAWHRIDANQVRSYLQARFDAHDDEVDRFLDAFVGDAYGMETGARHRADFVRNNYDAVVRLIDPEYVRGILRQRYGDTLDNPQYHPAAGTPLPVRIAHQFVFLHRQVLAQAAPEPVQQGQQPAEDSGGG